MFNYNKGECIKVVLKPDWNGNGNGVSAKDDNYGVIH